mmetsp:Transcript_143027/g.260096  ORF Transcript_143027/g.260096 Transcript_143027/m.260096 type:complete len:703 (+) Transcript_143027:88-2196(+)
MGWVWMSGIGMCLCMSYPCVSGATCSEYFFDNFGVAGGNAHDAPFDSTGQEHVLDNAVCTFSWHEYHDEPSATWNWYSDGWNFENFHGVDIVPKRNYEYWPKQDLLLKKPGNLLRSWGRGKNGPPNQAESIKLGECFAKQEDGGAWIIQRMGPFYSNGNYDWWQVGTRDVWHLSRVFGDHPAGIYFTTTLIATVSDNNKILGYPPIHMHHIHINPQPGQKFKMLSINGLGKTLANNVVEQHGDYQCLPKDGGFNCFFQKPPNDNVKEIDRVLDMEGEINDVRAPASETMKWWYQIAFRWHPKSFRKIQPLSHTFFNKLEPSLRNKTRWPWTDMPNEKDPYGNLHKSPQAPAAAFRQVDNQVEGVMTFDLNTSEHSIVWGTGRMFHGGDMIDNKIHSHNNMFAKAFWFRADPQELGLVAGAHRFSFHNAYEYILLGNTGFNTFEEMEYYLMDNLDAAKRIFANNCAPHFSSLPGCGFNTPFMICEAVTSNVEVYDDNMETKYLYDRRAKTCCNRWTFRQGEVWSTIGFFKPIIQPIGPWSPKIPGAYPEHLAWFMAIKFNGHPSNEFAFRKTHSYYTTHLYTPTNSSFSEAPMGDVWDYLLRLPPTLAPDLYMSGTWNTYCVSVMYVHRWWDGLHDGPNDYPGLMGEGIYSKYIDVNKYIYALAVVRVGKLVQMTRLWQYCVVLAGFMFMAFFWSFRKRAKQI